MDPSAPTILWQRVQSPSTKSMLFHCILNCDEKRTKTKQKEAGIFYEKNVSNRRNFFHSISAKKVCEPPPPVKCAVNECQNKKRYNCSKTGKPHCTCICHQYQPQLALIISAHLLRLFGGKPPQAKFFWPLLPPLHFF